MYSIILKAKHWQVFLLLFSIPIGTFYFILEFIIGIPIGPLMDRELLDNYFFYEPFIILFTSFCIGLWFWSVAIGLHRIIPPNLQLKVNRFKVLFFIPVIYLLFLVGLLAKIIPTVTSSNSNTQTILIFIFIFHLLSLWGILYSSYFIAKAIKTAELQRTVYFRDYFFLILALWFLPLGIWFLQPKLNKLVATPTANLEKKEGSFMLLDDELF